MAFEVIDFDWDGADVRTAILGAFDLMESRDHIPGILYATPKMVKSIVLAMPEEVEFDYIPEGIGRLRTVYLKYRNLPTDREMRLLSHDGDMVIRIRAVRL